MRIGHDVTAADRKAAAGAEGLAADGFADRKADARAEAAADHEHEHSAQRPGASVVDLEVIEHVPGRRRAEHHADEQADVLGDGQPESAPVSVREPDEGGDEDQEIDEIDQRAQPSNTLTAMSARTSRLGDNWSRGLPRR